MDIEFWSQHIRSQEKGRISIKKYCEEIKIPEWKFYSKRKLIRASESNFAEFSIMAEDFYEIQLEINLHLIAAKWFKPRPNNDIYILNEFYQVAFRKRV